MGQKEGRVEPKRAELGAVAAGAHLQNHHQARDRVMRVNIKTHLTQMIVRFPAKPADHLHPTIFLAHIDKSFAAQIVIEMDLVPGLTEPGEALRHCSDPDCLRMLAQEVLGSGGVIIEKKQAASGFRFVRC
jgi:hypothetical protein